MCTKPGKWAKTLYNHLSDILIQKNRGNVISECFSSITIYKLLLKLELVSFLKELYPAQLALNKCCLAVYFVSPQIQSSVRPLPLATASQDKLNLALGTCCCASTEVLHQSKGCTKWGEKKTSTSTSTQTMPTIDIKLR